MEMEELVIGFDFNCAGSIPIINGFLQLGASARDLKTGDLVDSFHEYSNMEGYECDPKVMKQLQKINEVEHMLVMEGVYKSNYSCHEIVALFIDWIEKITKNRYCIVLSSNMIYDGTLLRYFSKKNIVQLLGRRTVYLDTVSVYHGIASMHRNTKITEAAIKNNKAGFLATEVVSSKTPNPTKFESDYEESSQDSRRKADHMVKQWIFVQNHFET